MCHDYSFLSDRDLSHHSAQDPSAGARYSSSGVTFSSKTETVSTDNELEGENLPGEGYEKMEVSSGNKTPNADAKHQPQTHSCVQSEGPQGGRESRRSKSNLPGEVVHESIDSEY